jgi:predicted nicotinamide N-methyase
MTEACDVSRLRQALLWRIHRRYVTRTLPVRVGSLNLDFTRIENPDTVLNLFAAEADQLEKVTGKRLPDEALHLPFWAELWDSAMGVAQVLERRRDNLAGKRVLDLGCGQGLTGTVAAACGAKVLFADLEPPALMFARLNSLPWNNFVRTRQLNWQTDQLSEKFDLIIGADILYEKPQWPFLESFWEHHLAEGGLILLGEPGRQTGDDFIEDLPGGLWKYELLQEPISTRTKPIRVVELRRRALSRH